MAWLYNKWVGILHVFALASKIFSELVMLLRVYIGVEVMESVDLGE